MSQKKAVVIGAGFSGLSTACFLAKAGIRVVVVEKNDQAGGRARQYSAKGFTFDMGPSWYWMPDVFERFFNQFNKNTTDFYELERLDPSYTVFFDKDLRVDVPADFEELVKLFESFEKGSGEKLRKFIDQAAYKYKVGINDLVYKPSRSIFEFVSPKLLLDVIRMDVFQSFYSHARKFFKNKYLLQLIEFPILFLGAISKNTPALYSLMNYADLKLGTWYPVGGMKSVVNGMESLAKELGVEFRYNETVTGFNFEGNNITGVVTQAGTLEADVVVGSADYHHIETKLLPPHLRNYADKYWGSRVMAPSSIIYYLGFDTKFDNLLHHTLLFDEDFDLHSTEIYEKPQWPTKPLSYLCIPSKSDLSTAPEGHENVFALIPVAVGLDDTEEVRQRYLDWILTKLSTYTGIDVKKHLVYQKSYAHREFIQDYNSFKGNAYGLANTLMQTAILKPSLKNKKIRNLYYTGQLTVPGPGVPPSLISGEVVSGQVLKDFS